MIGRALTYGFAASLALSQAFGWPERNVLLPDDGDVPATVLELQAVVAGLLATGEYAAEADVNGDGRVDILDLQWLVSRSARTEDGDERAPWGGPSEAVTAAAPRAPQPAQATCLLRLEPGPPADPAGPVRARLEGFQSVPPRTERYLYTLTPNAPPWLGWPRIRGTDDL